MSTLTGVLVFGGLLLLIYGGMTYVAVSEHYDKPKKAPPDEAQKE